MFRQPAAINDDWGAVSLRTGYAVNTGERRLHMKSASVLAVRPDFYSAASCSSYAPDLSDPEPGARLLVNPTTRMGAAEAGWAPGSADQELRPHAMPQRARAFLQRIPIPERGRRPAARGAAVSTAGEPRQGVMDQQLRHPTAAGRAIPISRHDLRQPREHPECARRADCLGRSPGSGLQRFSVR
jgi:hypothetical protein